MIKKIIAIAVFLLLPIIAKSQVPITVATDYFLGGIQFSGYWSDFDSTGTYYSDWFDISNIDAQTMKLTYDFTSADSIQYSGGREDSCKMILEGLNPFNGVTTLFMDSDTLLVFRESGFTGKTTHPQQNSLSQSTSFPIVRWRLINVSSSATFNSRNNKTLRWAVYATVNDLVPSLKSFSNAPR